VAVHDGGAPRFAAAKRVLAPIQSQFRLAGLVIGAVALEAVACEDGPDLAVENILAFRRAKERGHPEQDRQNENRRAHGCAFRVVSFAAESGGDK